MSNIIYFPMECNRNCESLWNILINAADIFKHNPTPDNRRTLQNVQAQWRSAFLGEALGSDHPPEERPIDRLRKAAHLIAPQAISRGFSP